MARKGGRKANEHREKAAPAGRRGVYHADGRGQSVFGHGNSGGVGDIATVILQGLLEVFEHIAGRVGAKIIFGMTANLIDNHTGGTAVNGIPQSGTAGIGDIKQVSQNGAGGGGSIGSLIQGVPLGGLQGRGALELGHHLFFGQVLLTGTGTALVKG